MPMPGDACAPPSREPPAFIAIDSRLGLSAYYAWKRRAISDTNALPAEPDGIRKTLRL